MQVTTSATQYLPRIFHSKVYSAFRSRFERVLDLEWNSGRPRYLMHVKWKRTALALISWSIEKERKMKLLGEYPEGTRVSWTGQGIPKRSVKRTHRGVEAFVLSPPMLTCSEKCLKLVAYSGQSTRSSTVEYQKLVTKRSSLLPFHDLLCRSKEE